MKRLFFLIPVVVLFIVFYACQKEKSFEGSRFPSIGSLQSDITGECLPKTVAGAYEQDVALNDTFNYIEVQVDVTQGGSYEIFTDTLNGMWFSASGVFTSTGLQTVKVRGTGTPGVSGITNFTVMYDTTSCVVPVTVLGTGNGGPAEFSLSSTAGTCISATIAGDYVTNTALTAANTVTLQVNVTKIGTYNVTTTLSNGMTFTGTGTLGELGDQTIILTGSGTPTATGPTNIPVTVSATSFCSFTIEVVSTPVTGDYFPRTPGSNWSYERNDVFEDSALRYVITPTKLGGATTYNIFLQTSDASGQPDSSGYYTKSASDYIEYVDMGSYFGFDDPIWTSNVFLKDNLGINSSWYSSNYTGTYAPDATRYTWRLKYTVTKKNATVTVKGITYTNVIGIEERSEAYDPATRTWVDFSADIGYFFTQYAPNVGVISQNFTLSSSPTENYKIELRRSSVVL